VSGFLFDANVLLDIITDDPVWSSWSRQQVRETSRQGTLFLNPVIYAEIAPAFASQESLDEWFEGEILQSAQLPFSAAWPAAQAFRRYRAAGGTRRSPLPDFYIGAHALVEGLTLVTRDAARYRTYFPTVSLITP
jgi:predicted nucleic acid-binding protein